MERDEIISVLAELYQDTDVEILDGEDGTIWAASEYGPLFMLSPHEEFDDDWLCTFCERTDLAMAADFGIAIGQLELPIQLDFTAELSQASIEFDIDATDDDGEWDGNTQ